ncbi:MAG: hypothetical protein HC837_16755 [Chloroflexaceae bacterium]|nr:hypothetical protein [Chloroflexaceae bacterium]
MCSINTLTRRLARFSGLLFALIALLMLAPFAQAQEDNSFPFTYQGQLLDGENPLNDTCTFTASLWDAATEGNQVTELLILTDVAVVAGYVALELDFGLDPFSGDSHYLELSVQCSSDTTATLLGRTLLTATPHALYSAQTPWSGILDMPEGFADGVDNDTPYTAGDGLILTDTTFSIATNGVTSTNLANDAVDTAAIQDDAVTNAEIADGTILLADLNQNGCTDGQVIQWDTTANTWTCASVQDSNTTYSAGDGLDLNNAVFSIATLGVTTAMLASDAVTTAKIATDAVTDDALADASVDTAALQVDAVTTAKIVSDAVTDDELADEAVDTAALQAGAVTTAKITDGTILLEDLSQNSCTDGQIIQWNTTSSAWECAAISDTAWSLTGNAGTTAGTNFLGTTDDEALELHLNSNRALRLEPNATSPNVVGGWNGNTIGTAIAGGTIAGGGATSGINQVFDNYGSIGGGYNNTAGSDDDDTSGQRYATVGGGDTNTASAGWATVGGGDTNTASGENATIAGGWDNTADGFSAAVGGGSFNTASGDESTVGGGDDNVASGADSTVSGGDNNLASNESSTVGGGQDNSASGEFATVGGGDTNEASGESATIAGGWNNTASGLESTIGGGQGNTTSADRATVPGGRDALASQYGQWAYASGNFATTGDAQTSMFVLRNEFTAAATDEPLYLNGDDQEIEVPTDTTITFEVLISARQDDGDSAGYECQGVVDNDSGTVTLIFDTCTELVDEDTNLAVSLDVNGTNLQILVTNNAETTRWVAVVRTAEVSTE